MPVDPLVVRELRAAFDAGATPSALVRRIAARHPGEPRADTLVRDYFREAFGVPMVRVGPEQVAAIAAGGSVPALTVSVLPRMLAGGDRPGWLGPAAERPAPVEPERIPELAGSWDRMDDTAKEYIRRLLAAAGAAHEQVAVLAALAERLQDQAAATAGRETRRASA
jgi:hypothetical protein